MFQLKPAQLPYRQHHEGPWDIASGPSQFGRAEVLPDSSDLRQQQQPRLLFKLSEYFQQEQQ